MGVENCRQKSVTNRDIAQVCAARMNPLTDRNTCNSDPFLQPDNQLHSPRRLVCSLPVPTPVNIDHTVGSAFLERRDILNDLEFGFGEFGICASLPRSLPRT